MAQANVYKIKLVRELSPYALEWRNSDYSQYRQHLPISAHHHAKWLNRIEEDSTIEMFGIQLIEEKELFSIPQVKKEESEIIGQCGLTSISTINGTAEYSLLIADNYRNHGYGKKALQQLLDFGFNKLRLHCIWGEIFDTNGAGLALAESVGFQVEGHLKDRYYKNGEYISTKIVSFIRQ